MERNAKDTEVMRHGALFQGEMGRTGLSAPQSTVTIPLGAIFGGNGYLSAEQSWLDEIMAPARGIPGPGSLGAAGSVPQEAAEAVPDPSLPYAEVALPERLGCGHLARDLRQNSQWMVSELSNCLLDPEGDK